MKLSDWIKEVGGDREVARLLKISRRTPAWWREGKTTPRWVTLQKIVKLSRGRVGALDIYKETKRKSR